MRDLAALRRYLAQRADMPFAWGRRANDCGSFALGAIEAMTGRDVLPGVTWTTPRGALRVIKRGRGLDGITDRALRRIAPARAMRGDVAAIRDGNGIALVIVEGETLVGPGERGLMRVPRSAMLMAWAID